MLIAISWQLVLWNSFLNNITTIVRKTEGDSKTYKFVRFFAALVYVKQKLNEIFF